MYVTGMDKCGQVRKYDCLGDSGTSVLKFEVAVFMISGYLTIYQCMPCNIPEE
jgi:hypothetical protein